MGDYITEIVAVCLTLLLFVSIITGGIYFYHKLEIENFQKTIADLSDEQKCMHICGFNYINFQIIMILGSSYFDQYKFCIEKCDRISERAQKCAA